MTSAGANTWSVPLEINNLESQISGGGGGSGVSQIIASNNIVISPPTGVGAVSIKCSLSALDQSVAGAGFNFVNMGGSASGTPAIVLGGGESYVVENTDFSTLILADNTGVQLCDPTAAYQAKTNTPAFGTNDKQIATTEFVQSAITGTGNVASITAGTNITVDNTNPNIPIVGLATPLTSAVQASEQIIGGLSTDGLPAGLTSEWKVQALNAGQNASETLSCIKDNGGATEQGGFIEIKADTASAGLNTFWRDVPIGIAVDTFLRSESGQSKLSMTSTAGLSQGNTTQTTDSTGVVNSYTSFTAGTNTITETINASVSKLEQIYNNTGSVSNSTTTAQSGSMRQTMSCVLGSNPLGTTSIDEQCDSSKSRIKVALADNGGANPILNQSDIYASPVASYYEQQSKNISGASKTTTLLTSATNGGAILQTDGTLGLTSTGTLSLSGSSVVAPTVVPSTTNDTQVATTAFVQSAITGFTPTLQQVLTAGDTSLDQTITMNKTSGLGVNTIQGDQINILASSIPTTFARMTRDGIIAQTSGGANQQTASGQLISSGVNSITYSATGITQGVSSAVPLTISTVGSNAINITSTGNTNISSSAGNVVVEGTTFNGTIITPSTANADLDLNTNGTGAVNITQAVAGTNSAVRITQTVASSATNQTLRLVNSNVGNSAVALELFKNNTVGATNDVVSQLNFFGKDSAGTKTQFGGIESIITSAGGGGGVDGALDFYSCVNGVKSQVFRMNGADNENNSFRPLDMNGNDIKTSSGNLTITSVASSGTGNLNLNAKQHIQLIPGTAGDIIGLTTNGNVSLTANEPGGTTNGFITLTADRGVGLTSAIGGSNGNIILDVNNIGDLQLQGTTLESASAGGSSGQHLRIKLNGTYYKIQLLND